MSVQTKSCHSFGRFTAASSDLSVQLPTTAHLPEMGKKAFPLYGLFQRGNSAEQLEGPEKQDIVAHVIRAGLAQADHAETPGPRDRKRLRRKPAADVVVILALVNFHPRAPVVRALDDPALQMLTFLGLIGRPDRVVRWLDSESLEVLANPLAGLSSEQKNE
jgi:hypothetical protein